jgi:hypothetical protein
MLNRPFGSRQVLEDIAVAEMELWQMSAGTLDVDAVLDFAESVLLNASNLWIAADLQQKRRLQQVLFPEGLEYEKGAY